jgi:hypothetical protein
MRTPAEMMRAARIVSVLTKLCRDPIGDDALPP